jgi:hypothetical protein
MRARVSTLATALGLLLWSPLAHPVAAQSSDRIVIGVNGGVQTGATRLTDHFEFETNVETATVDVKYPARAAVLIDGSVAVRLWKQLGAGVAVSETTRSGSADVDARIPHPLLFQQPRTVSGSQSGVSDAQTGIHLQLSYAVPVTRRLTITLAGGPSYVHVSQDVVSDVKYSESYPYDVATFTSATTKPTTAGAVGFNAGADVRWMFARSFGIGGMVRFTRATVDLGSGDRALSVDAGGVQVGAGVRVAF